jgi:hypothetical protein
MKVTKFLGQTEIRAGDIPESAGLHALLLLLLLVVVLQVQLALCCGR